jgi:hypothetical protein
VMSSRPFGVMSSCPDVIVPVRHRVRGCSAFTRPRTARPSATRPHSPPRSARPVRTLAAALRVAPSACSCDACGARIALCPSFCALAWLALATLAPEGQ